MEDQYKVPLQLLAELAVQSVADEGSLILSTRIAYSPAFVHFSHVQTVGHPYDT